MGLYLPAIVSCSLAATGAARQSTPPPSPPSRGFHWVFFKDIAWGQVQESFLYGKPVAQIPGRFRSPTPVIVPAEVDSTHMFLRLRVDGEDRLFSLDTGVAESSIKASAWLKFKGKTTTEINFSGDLKKPNVFKSKLDATDGDFWDAQFFSDVEPKSESVVGVLGNDFLSHRVLMFDALHGRAMIWDSEQSDLNAAVGWAMLDKEEEAVVEPHRADMKAPWTVVPLAINDMGDATVSGSVDGHHFDFLVDTGYPHALLKDSTLSQATHYIIGQKTEPQAGSQYKSTSNLVKDLNVSFMSQKIGFAESIADGFDAVIGEDTLERGMWIIDRPHNLFAFKAYINTTSKPEYSMSNFRQIGSQVFLEISPLTLEAEVTQIEDEPTLKSLDLNLASNDSDENLKRLGLQFRNLSTVATHMTAEILGQTVDVPVTANALKAVENGLVLGKEVAGNPKTAVELLLGNQMPPPPPGDPARGMAWQFDSTVGWHEIPVPNKPSEDPLDPQTYREIRGIGYWETKLMHVERSGEGIAIVPIKETPEEFKARVERLNARYAKFKGPIFITPDGFVNPIVLDGGPLHLPKGTTTKGLNWKREDLATGDFVMVPPGSQQTKKDGVPIYYSAGKSLAVPDNSTAMYLQEKGPYQAGDWRSTKGYPGMLKLINPIYDERKWSNFFLAFH